MLKIKISFLNNLFHKDFQKQFEDFALDIEKSPLLNKYLIKTNETTSVPFNFRDTVPDGSVEELVSCCKLFDFLTGIYNPLMPYTLCLFSVDKETEPNKIPLYMLIFDGQNTEAILISSCLTDEEKRPQVVQKKRFKSPLLITILFLLISAFSVSSFLFPKNRGHQQTSDSKPLITSSVFTPGELFVGEPVQFYITASSSNGIMRVELLDENGYSNSAVFAISPSLLEDSPLQQTSTILEWIPSIPGEQTVTFWIQNQYGVMDAETTLDVFVKEKEPTE